MSKDLDVLDQAHHFKDITVGLFHIGEIEHAVVLQGLLDHAGKNGNPDGVDILHIGEIDDERVHALPEILFARLLEAHRPHVIDVSFGCKDGHVL